MFDRKQAKLTAKQNFKKHYLVLVFTCLMTAFLGIKYSGVLAILSAEDEDADLEAADQAAAAESTNIIYEFVSGNIGIKIDGENILTEDLDKAQEKFEENKSKSYKLGPVEVSLAEGEFAKFANMFVTGSYVTTIYKGIHGIVGSDRAALIIMITVSLLLRLLMTGFIINVFAVILSRVFLEASTYGKVPVRSFFVLLRSKKWLHSAFVLIVRDIYRALWSLTLIGGVIKAYSYHCVPYILAECPDLTANETVTLSRKMMKGHKWELFKLQMSFIGWEILGAMTAGIASIFYVNPYYEATLAEFYRSVRAQAKEAGIENIDRLQDELLYEKAPAAELETAYSDIEELIAETESFTDGYTGARAFFANVFGIIPAYSERTEAIDRNEVKKIKISQYRDEVEGEAYPARLAPIPPSPRRDRLGTVFYTRCYSVTSLILMFFIGCFIGWLWEFIYKFIEIGEFVNRGVLHGPWLPIYGTGAVMILIVLKKFRRSAVAEFFAAVVLCGFVEYFTAYFLELTHDGQKWWDYSGYFLNIHGRVCAEGLMVFGIGGVAFVYFGAPMLDNLIRRIKTRTAAIICAVLVTVFAADGIYSHFYPNQGKGITDYPAAESTAADTSSEE